MTLKNIFGKEVYIELVDNQEVANFITHSGTFHSDEVMATVILLNLFDNIKLCRTNTVINKDAFIYDIGFGEFDHHQADFDLKRDNGIKYASCGLIWKKYGLEIINKLNINDKNAFYNAVDKNIIMDIDRDDNGQMLKNEPEIKMQNIPNLISNFNPTWDAQEDENECFLKAVSFANDIFDNIVKNIIAKENARKIIEKKIEESKNNILILDSYMPWKEIVLSSSNPKAKDILFAIYPSKRGGYNVVATPKATGSFEIKKKLPSAWSGLENEDLQKVSGVDTITFCHKNLFICACKTYEDALKIANIAVNNEE